jgi:LPS O-antigen subunit length determinant protein (WzzB/FepE family)
MINEQENSSSKENEISIIELWEVLFKKRLLIIVVTALFGVASIIYALTATELWKPEVMIYPSEIDSNENSSLNSAISQFISPNSQNTKTSKYLAILFSRNFLLKFIEDENISKNLFEEEWDTKKNTWKSEKPSEYALYSQLKNSIEVDKEEATGIIRVSFTWYDKYFAASTVNKLIDQLNTHIRLSEVEEYKKQLTYIEDQIKKTNLNQVRSVLFNIVENLSSSIMIAETRLQYAFKVIDYASPPEFRFFPQRTNLVLLWTFIGFFMSCVLSLLINIFVNLKKHK